jgi:hypothetical protein
MALVLFAPRKKQAGDPYYHHEGNKKLHFFS